MNKLIYFFVVSLIYVNSSIAFQLSGNINIIKQVESNFHPIWVFEDNIHRCMAFDKNIRLVQTCIVVNHKEQLAFDYYKVAIGTLLFNPNLKNILIIGVGGGVLPKTFAYLLPHANIEAVDINPEVIELAKEFFGLEDSKKLKTIVADGIDYVNCAKSNHYDLIIMDAFGSDYIPKSMLTANFFDKLKSLLTTNGIIFINSFYNSKLSTIEDNLFNQVFGDFHTIPVASHRLVIAGKNNTKPALHNLQHSMRLWKEKFFSIGLDINWLLDKFCDYQTITQYKN